MQPPSRRNKANVGDMLIGPFAWESRNADAEEEDANARCGADNRPRLARHARSRRLVVAANTLPEVPDQRQVDEHGGALQPYDPFPVVRQERHLPLKQNQNRDAHQGNPSNEPQREAAEARSLLGGTDEQLQHEKW